jgi:hypothetical protein
MMARSALLAYLLLLVGVSAASGDTAATELVAAAAMEAARAQGATPALDDIAIVVNRADFGNVENDRELGPFIAIARTRGDDAVVILYQSGTPKTSVRAVYCRSSRPLAMSELALSKVGKQWEASGAPGTPPPGAYEASDPAPVAQSATGTRSGLQFEEGRIQTNGGTLVNALRVIRTGAAGRRTRG